MKEIKDYIKLFSFRPLDMAAYIMLKERCLRLFYKDTLIDIGLFWVKTAKIEGGI
ncbi:hypothetical protein J7J62_03960 [bacterium]|nr:hypothetical protein [bacterium]